MAVIEIRIRRLEQLFESLDPAPFCERTLHKDAERYIVDRASELPPRADLHLRIDAPGNVCVHSADAIDAIHRHFQFAHDQAEHGNRRRMQAGRVALIIGLAVMSMSLSVRAFLGSWLMSPSGAAVGEGLLILAWVVLWRPAEILLFERWESRQERRLFARLARIAVEFRMVADDPQ